MVLWLLEAQALLKDPALQLHLNRFYTSPELPDCPTYKEKVAACIFLWKPQLLKKWFNLKKKHQKDKALLRGNKTQL